MKTLLQHLLERQPLLTLGALVFALLTALGLVLMYTDTQTVLGINRWIKPLKFSISIGLFLLTMAWVLDSMEAEWLGGQRLWLAHTMLWVMVVEQVLVTTQAVRGVPSHFNASSALNVSIYAIMGVAIFINTMALAVLWYKSSTMSFNHLDPMWASSIRWGLALLILGSLQGMYMSSSGSSIVGGNYGASGIPFLNWSTQFGDMRVAHFIALHGIHILLLLSYVLQQFHASSVWSIRLVGILVVLLTVVAQMQAVAGKSVV